MTADFYREQWWRTWREIVAVPVWSARARRAAGVPYMLEQARSSGSATEPVYFTSGFGTPDGNCLGSSSATVLLDGGLYRSALRWVSYMLEQADGVFGRHSRFLAFLWG